MQLIPLNKSYGFLNGSTLGERLLLLRMMCSVNNSFYQFIHCTICKVIVEYGYSILRPVSKRTFVKWCFLEKEKDFPTHFYHPYSFLS